MNAEREEIMPGPHLALLGSIHESLNLLDHFPCPTVETYDWKPKIGSRSKSAPRFLSTITF